MYKNLSKLAILFALAFMLSSCASQANRDPLEGMNRGIYKFNDVADKAVFKPVATAYKAVAPTFVRKGFNNFFNNLSMINTVINDLLQFKFSHAFTDAGRFVINSTFGIAGFIDLASMDNIEMRKEDFGQTLGHWGVGTGAYLVLPFLGPSDIRDTAGLVTDRMYFDPVNIQLHRRGQIRLQNQLLLAAFIDKRTELLEGSDLIDEASLDPYAFMRDAYLQRRASLVQDGLVPKEFIKDDFEGFDNEPVQNVDPEPAKGVDTEPAKN